MCGIVTYSWLSFMVNVGKHTIHGSCGIVNILIMSSICIYYLYPIIYIYVCICVCVYMFTYKCIHSLCILSIPIGSKCRIGLSCPKKRQVPRFTLEIKTLPTNLNPTKSTETEHKGLGVQVHLCRGGSPWPVMIFMHAGGVEIAEADCHWDLESLSCANGWNVAVRSSFFGTWS